MVSLIRPFRGLCPLPQYAAEVIAPPYDVLNTKEARQRARGKPWSFLHVSRAEIDLPEGTDPYDPSVYTQAVVNMDKMLDEGVLSRDDSPIFYAYRLIMDEHSQIGLVAAASVIAYDANRIRKHEFTRPAKEDDRVRQIEAVNAQTGPVLLAYSDTPDVDEMLARATEARPGLDVTADDGVRHTLWPIADDQIIHRLTAAFEKMPTIYIADGHHRSAAASRVCANRRRSNSKHTGAEPYNYFLSVIFPHHQMQILEYNRVVKDLNQHSPAKLLKLVAENFNVESSDIPVKPAKHMEFGMYLQDRWYRLNLHQELFPRDDPVARLDVSLLTRFLVEPFLQVHDPRRDERIDFVGGIRGLEELERRVDSGEMEIAFSLYPTRMEDLMSVADANKVMPPKSTWFEPKLADGLISHMLD